MNLTQTKKMTDHELKWLRQVHAAGTIAPEGEAARLAEVLRERGYVRRTGTPGQQLYVLSGPGVLAITRPFAAASRHL